eukprot:1161248-Pelagomonas_calceolata.AAC.7
MLLHAYALGALKTMLHTQGPMHTPGVLPALLVLHALQPMLHAHTHTHTHTDARTGNTRIRAHTWNHAARTGHLARTGDNEVRTVAPARTDHAARTRTEARTGRIFAHTCTGAHAKCHPLAEDLLDHAPRTRTGGFPRTHTLRTMLLHAPPPALGPPLLHGTAPGSLHAHAQGQALGPPCCTHTHCAGHATHTHCITHGVSYSHQ